jgi:hypothetical protein
LKEMNMNLKINWWNFRSNHQFSYQIFEGDH